MQINGPAHVHGAQPLNSPHRAANQPSLPATPSRVDQLDISPEAQFVSQVRELPEIRTEKVAALKAAIESGTYETEHRLSHAVDALLDELV